MHTYSILQVNSNIKTDSIYSMRHQIHQLQQPVAGSIAGPKAVESGTDDGRHHVSPSRFNGTRGQ